MINPLIISLTQTCEVGRDGNSITMKLNRVGLEGISYLSSGSKEGIYSIKPVKTCHGLGVGAGEGSQEGLRQLSSTVPVPLRGSPCSAAWNRGHVTE